jgi:hypothetical protein
LFLGKAAIAQVGVINLLTENLRDPTSIDNPAPRFSWQLAEKSGKPVLQQAYEIEVDSADGTGDNFLRLWSSGKVPSEQSLYVPYQGGLLRSGHHYFWKVRVWDNYGRQSEWSELSSWKMGLLSPADWQAKWIGPAYKDTVNGPAPLLRTTVSLDKDVREATAYITSRGFYEAKINGHKVGSDYLTPGWTSYNKRLQYQAYDVTNLFKEGENAITVMLGSGWYRSPLGPYTPRPDFYGKAVALLLQIKITYRDGSEKLIVSDEHWKSSTGELRFAEIYDGCIIDSRLEQQGWLIARFNDSGWQPVKLFPVPKNDLIATYNEPVKKQETFKPVKILMTQKGEKIIDFGQNLVGWVQIALKGKAGDSIKISHAEVLDRSGDLYTENLRAAKARDIYILSDSGKKIFEPKFTWQGFRYIKIEGLTGDPDPEDITAVAIYSDMRPTGSFSCSNALLNQLQHNIQWGQKGNFLDVPTDCPQRDERLGWTGDAQVFSRTASFNRDVHNFFSKWLRDVAADQYPSGSIPHVIPDIFTNGKNEVGGSSGWGDVCTIVPWNMYIAYGDKKILESQSVSMKAWVRYMEKQTRNGLWVTGEHFGDWLFYSVNNDRDGTSAITDKYLIAQCFYAYSTQILINCSKVLNKRSDELYYSRLLQKIKAAFVKEYVTPNGLISSNTQTAYVLALEFDMLPESLRHQAAKRLAEIIARYNYHLTTGFLGTPYLCNALSRFGYADVAYKLLLQDTYPSWLYPIKAGATTIWERWDGIRTDGSFEDPSMNSFNHYAYGAIGDWMYQNITGIQAAAPGYKKIVIKPVIGGGLKWAEGDFDCPYGRIHCKWEVVGERLDMTVTIPQNTTAEVFVPDWQGKNYKRSTVGAGNYHFVSGAKGQNALESAFITAPDSIQTSVYWYWLSGNVSKKGVIRDLEAMKKVGINRAFIGDIGLNDVPSGKVKFRSDEWWDILHTALKTATRLNIQIGIFNGPGWSQSGGPWVRPEQAMRYLTASEIMVKGPVSLNRQLARPQADFQDVKVLAYPVPADYDTGFSALSTGLPLHQGQQFSLDINTAKPYTVRSVTISTFHDPVYFEGDIQVKTNNDYVTVKHFTVDRRGPALNHGFIPWGKAVVSIPATTSSSFRLLLTKISSNSGITELKLSAAARVDSYMEKTLAKAWQTEDLDWNAYQWGPQRDELSAYSIDPGKIIDISKYMDAEGRLNWNVPPGNWMIERTGMTPTNVRNVPATPETTGFETDKMSVAHIGEHFDAYLGEILRRIPPEDRKTFTVVVADSYETGSQNWTDRLIPEFNKTYGYDATPFIPVLQGKIVGGANLSDRFLWDLRRLIADDVAYNYIGGLRELSHKHGLTTWLENYGYFGFPAEFLQYGGQSDEVAGEFWCEGHLGNVENKAASSAAHIYGKTRVSAESFTSAGNHWRRYPAMLKARGDRFFTDGINNTLLHVYIHQPEDDPKPGLGAWFGTEFNRANTWFFDSDIFIKYIKRCNLLLQQGQYVADVAYFIGEDAPKLMGITDPELPRGYSFDYINSEVIKNSLTVKEGKLTLPNGISYSILVLPKLKTMRPELLSKIKELVENGAVVLGPKPERSPSLQGYPRADDQVRSMANELWGNIDGAKNKIHHYGKGLVISGMNMQEALDLVKLIPDCKTGTNDDGVLFIHRQLEEGAIYFISNQKNEPVDIVAQFRIAGKEPELWDAVSGTVRDLPSFWQTAGTTSIPLHLAPNGSSFILFRKDGTKGDTARSNYPKSMKSIAIIKPWTVVFDSKGRGPEKPVLFDTLTDWSLHANDSIKYYSGTAYYHNTFKLEKPEDGIKYVIDLGVARDIAKVSVNGVELGGAWTPPYQVDITRALKRGENKLEIKVVNTWVNRLLGDALLPANRRKTAALFGPDPGAGLEPSGLLGPVKIDLYKEIL